MLWADKLEEWASSQVTKAFRKNCEEAIRELHYKMVYEENDRSLAILQGMVRAYLDVLSIIENKDIDEEKEQEDESGYGS